MTTALRAIQRDDPNSTLSIYLWSSAVLALWFRSLPATNDTSAQPYRRTEKQEAVVAAQQAQIKAQQQEIEMLKEKLQRQNAFLQERLARLEKLVGNQAQTVAQK